ncbi:SDR family oxidoreductase [uncultured Paraglaciecola sp.]|uniref:SDR family NAD(P)-dependent oxidoreductase n=1 Tax=uncultured Paraglaciecola sp. TaxID=1765024 RepID=UPI0030D6F6EC|tara:strand:- start:90613 stop:91383 length:771 start_codon:yes stop_codon:yes gene_type:complete
MPNSLTPLKFDKPVCIVTGGSYGIGDAVCEKFSSQNYRVINLDIQANPAQSKAIEWRKCDMSISTEVKICIQTIIEQYARVDCLVSNAGIHFSATIEDTSEEDFDRVFDLNVKGAIAATKAVLPQMKSQNNGVILYMASDQALIAKHNSFAYNMSKAALASMAKTTALDYAKYQIRANAICPGTIETPLYHKAINNYVAKSGADCNQVHAEEAALQPLGRLGQASEVAAFSYFLASEEAKFITGSLQVIDGGYTTQ